MGTGVEARAPLGSVRPPSGYTAGREGEWTRRAGSGIRTAAGRVPEAQRTPAVLGAGMAGEAQARVVPGGGERGISWGFPRSKEIKEQLGEMETSWAMPKGRRRNGLRMQQWVIQVTVPRPSVPDSVQCPKPPSHASLPRDVPVPPCPGAGCPLRPPLVLSPGFMEETIQYGARSPAGMMTRFLSDASCPHHQLPGPRYGVH